MWYHPAAVLLGKPDVIGAWLILQVCPYLALPSYTKRIDSRNCARCRAKPDIPRQHADTGATYGLCVRLYPSTPASRQEIGIPLVQPMRF
jgi:hypothetical protein